MKTFVLIKNIFNKQNYFFDIIRKYYLFIPLIGLLILIYLGLRFFVYSTFTIPSDSMQPTIKCGDRVLVEKLSTGVRLIEYRKAAKGERLKVNRTLHWGNIKRDDVLVFNFVYNGSWDSIVMNWDVYFIKRCIAIPGDTIEIKDFKYVVNMDTLEEKFPSSKIKNRYLNDSIARSNSLRGYMSDLTDSIDRWTVKDFGPLIVPKKGMSLPIDTISYRRYSKIIKYETGLFPVKKDSSIVLGDKIIRNYVFSNNYYFMAGDNYLKSMDSRYWGLVPEDFIVGKAILIYWSEKEGKIKWDRILKSIR